MKKFLVSLFLVFLFLFGSRNVVSAMASEFHAIHISYTQAEWTGNTLAGKVSYYKDDYLKAVGEWAKKDLAALSSKERSWWCEQYLKAYFRAWSGDFQHPLDLHIDQLQEDEASYIFNFSYAVPAASRSIILDNRVIQQQFSDQTNLILVKAFGETYNHSSTTGSPTFTISHNN